MSYKRFNKYAIEIYLQIIFGIIAIVNFIIIIKIINVQIYYKN